MNELQLTNERINEWKKEQMRNDTNTRDSSNQINSQKDGQTSKHLSRMMRLEVVWEKW